MGRARQGLAVVDLDVTTPPAALPCPRRGTGAETVLHFPDVPIYSELAGIWRAAGRTVPGHPDPLWDVLAAGPGRRRRVRSTASMTATGPTGQ
jgi:hypothetical protein